MDEKQMGIEQCPDCGFGMDEIAADDYTAMLVCSECLGWTRRDCAAQ